MLASLKSLPAHDICAIVLIIAGLFFFFTATVGLLRFPDFYTRMHATGKGDTLAVLLTITGAMCHHGFNLNSAKLGLIALFVFIANPTATHAIGRAAYRCGIKPWLREHEPQDSGEPQK